MNSAKAFFILAAIALIISGLLLVKRIDIPTLSLQLPDPAKVFENLQTTFEAEIATNSNESSSSATPSTTTKPTEETPTQPTKPTLPPPTPHSIAPIKACVRVVVPHLDGSTSNRCYTPTDAETLRNLVFKYTAAHSSALFYQKVADSYFDNGQQFNSDFFKQAGQEAAAKAEAEKNRVGEISLEMYAIEARGW